MNRLCLKLFLITLALFVSNLRNASGDDVNRCTEPIIDHVTERLCLEQAFNSADANLRQAEKKLREALTNWKEDKCFKDSALAKFDKSIKSFRLYRHDACEFEASATAGGNGAGDMRLECATRLSNERLEKVNEAIKWFLP